MTCDRYWREGILLVERGLPDPHREGCADCQRAHASRDELIEALPLIGEGYTGDPRWQSNVWERIDGKPARAHWRWLLEGVLAAASLLFLLIGLGLQRPLYVLPLAEVIPQSTAMRSKDPHVDDRLRVTVGPTSEVWIYRDRRLALRCKAMERSPTCAAGPRGGMQVEMVLEDPVAYSVIMVDGPRTEPREGLDQTRAALQDAGVAYREESIVVH